MTHISRPQLFTNGDLSRLVVNLLYRMQEIESRLDLTQIEIDELGKSLEKVVRKNQELSWAACPLDVDGTSCEDWLQNRQE